MDTQTDSNEIIIYPHTRIVKYSNRGSFLDSIENII